MKKLLLLGSLYFPLILFFILLPEFLYFGYEKQKMIEEAIFFYTYIGAGILAVSKNFQLDIKHFSLISFVYLIPVTLILWGLYGILLSVLKKDTEITTGLGFVLYINCSVLVKVILIFILVRIFRDKIQLTGRS